ncbi:MAG: DMT family transporter [Burkholderiaceae bacterium]
MSSAVAHFLKPSRRAIGIAAALITIAVWTAFIVIARASAHGSLLPLDIGFLRIAGAGLVLVPLGFWLVRRHQLAGWLGLSPYGFRVTALVGGVGGVGYAALAYAGFFYAPAAHGSVLMPGTLPLSTALIAVLLLGESLTRRRVWGLALILGGDLLVGGASLLGAFDGGQVWKGDLIFLLASTCWALYSVLLRKHALDAVRATVAITVFAVLTYMPVYALLVLAEWLPSQLAAAPWRELTFHLVFQGLGSVVISGITFTKMIEHFGPVRSTMMTALVPGLSALLAVPILGEPLSWNLLLGLAFVTGGIVLGVFGAAPAQPLLRPADPAAAIPAK